MGWKELYGLANRTDFDLRQHQEFSGEDLTYFDQETGTRFLPHVIEPTFGVDRTFLVVLLDAYDEEDDRRRQWQTRHAHRLAARSQDCALQGGRAAVDEEAGTDEVAREIFDRLQAETEFLVDYDETGNIGKRYRRQDEIGTPFCFTVDPDSLDDGKVTVRDRDTTEQERIAIDDVVAWVVDKVK